MLKIRLTRVGKTNSPRYRVVVADHKKAVKGKFIEILGHYNPAANPREIVINKERAIFWMERGAQASDTVHNLMCDLEILKSKIDKKYAKKFTKKQIKEGITEEKPAAKAEEKTETDVEVEAVSAKEAEETETTAELKPEEEAPEKEENTEK